MARPAVPGRLDLTVNPIENEGEGSPAGDFAVSQGNRNQRAGSSTVVRYGHMGLVGDFANPPHARFRGGNKVVIQTDRGIELGETLNLTCSGCEKAIPREQMLRYLENCGPDYLRLNGGRILREATHADLAEERHLRGSEREKLDICERLIEARSLSMTLVDCEHLFGGERIIFYFMSEGRIDFRDLVRDLAREFQTRIEMRQVGARDEARLVADYETCGRECCCKNFLKTLKPVSMKMAKMQKATLDPSKVSGRCGRLKCCLRYEQDTYEELDQRLPQIGTRVRTQAGEGTIVERQILTQLLQIQTDENQRVTVSLDDVLATGVPAPRTAPQTEQANGRRAPSARTPPENRGAAESDDAERRPAGYRAEDPSKSGEPPASPGERRGRRRRRGRRSGEVDGSKDAARQESGPASEPSADKPDEAE
jgi:cell fate regulator YaaT (PSP1 superfamily)